MLGVLLQIAAPAAPAAPADTGPLRTARTAQARFESVRRMHLPRDRAWFPERCDARIGRFCYWYDSTESAVVPEPSRIADSRRQLLATLAQAARALPGDAWIAGQRVAYLIEAGRRGDALAVARECRSERWWCEALAGLALHEDQRYADADSAFSLALTAMAPEQRCEWFDLRRMVVQPLARELGAASCDGRVRIANALWEIAVPLFSTKGNDIRTEHFSRHTMALIRARSASAYGVSWGNDSRELLLRYGWSDSYSRSEPRSALYDQGDVIGHPREPSYAFFPDIRSVHGVPWIAPDAWRLRAGTAESRYAPRYLRRIVALPHQLARFPRGDSLLVAVAIAVEDSALRHDSVVVTLGALGRQWRTIVTGGPTLSLVIPNDSAVTSIEALGVHTRRVAWARYSIGPVACASGLCVSDLLLIRGIDRPTSVAAGLRAAHTGMTVQASRPLGVAWEVRASASREPVRMTLTVEPMEVTIARRIAARLGLTDLPAPVRLHWTAVTDASRLENTTLRLPPRARGKHRLHLRVERGTQWAAASREVDLIP